MLARYAISTEGAAALKSLAEGLLVNANSILEANKTLVNQVSSLGEGLGVFEVDIIGIATKNQSALKENREEIINLANLISKKADEVLEIIGLSGGGISSSGGSVIQNHESNTHSIQTISDWLPEVNPHYSGDPFSPYSVNCGSCAFAVNSRLSGADVNATANATNIPTDAAMEQVTGKKCVYMSTQDIEAYLKKQGAGSHVIVGINRKPTLWGKTRAGHWFNAYYDGNEVHTVDGQSGQLYDWPHDYGEVSEWCALV